MLAPRRPGAPVACAVAPGVSELGVMLPYAPLHHVLLADLAASGAEALVLTSGNVSDEPIAFRDGDALGRLESVADAFLVHDRPIETRTDDSVVRGVAVGPGRRPLTLRRSRGYVPASIGLPVAARRPLLACGSQLKATFCLARGRRAWVSHHIGDLEHYPALLAYRQGIGHFERLFALRPELIAHDLHPDYASTAFALELDGCEPHRRPAPPRPSGRVPRRARPRRPGRRSDLRRLGLRHRRHDLGWRDPRRRPRDVRARRLAARRCACPAGSAPCASRGGWPARGSHLQAAERPRLPEALAGTIERDRWDAVASIGESAAVSPETSSMGRLFDAVAALCGLRAQVSYEGQAAVELEACAAEAADSGAYDVPLGDQGGERVIDPRAAITAIAGDIAAGAEVSAVAAARSTRAWLSPLRLPAPRPPNAAGSTSSFSPAACSRIASLLERTAALLGAARLRVLVPERLPPNDGGISFGQAAVAAARDRVAVE